MSTEMKFDNDELLGYCEKEILNCISIEQEGNKEIRKVWKVKKGEDVFEQQLNF